MNNRQEIINMIHELRGPLDNIRLSVEMLRSALHKEDEEIFLGVINRSALKIDNFINSFHISEPDNYNVLNKSNGDPVLG
jgi:signal transduction histidine kinase